MTKAALKILVVGATGSIGRPVVAEALRQRHKVRALVRDTRNCRLLGDEVDFTLGDLTEPGGLAMALEGKML